jgi:hypothetical protein
MTLSRLANNLICPKQTSFRDSVYIGTRNLLFGLKKSIGGTYESFKKSIFVGDYCIRTSE